MTFDEAYQFIEKSISPPSTVWADLGAGSGTFTLPISQLLGNDGKVFAIDLDAKVLEITHLSLPNSSAEIIPIQKDFTKTIDLPPLDGIFLANALHYVKDQMDFLQQCIYKLKPDGKIVFIEYDREVRNPWVPYPVPFWKLKKMTLELNLTEAKELNRKSSKFGNGDLYLAVSEKRI